jgi:hypothetical protein
MYNISDSWCTNFLVKLFLHWFFNEPPVTSDPGIREYSNGGQILASSNETVHKSVTEQILAHNAQGKVDKTKVSILPECAFWVFLAPKWAWRNNFERVSEVQENWYSNFREDCMHF